MANYARSYDRNGRHIGAVACLAFVAVQGALCWIGVVWVGREVLTRLMVGM